MRPSIFDERRRDITGGADHLVSQFEYLNRSDRDEAQRVRDLIDSLFSRYPADAGDALRTRLRSVDDNEHLSAFFELVLHELLLRSKCQVLAVQPSLESTRRPPDFRAQTEAGTRFYLEATLATGRSDTQRGEDRRLDEALQAIDSVQSPDSDLFVCIEGTPAAPVNGGRLKQRLEDWLRTRNNLQITTRRNDEGTDRTKFSYEQNGVTFRITSMPRHQTHGMTERARSIAGRTLAPLSASLQVPICTAVRKKAEHYGDLDAPCVVAVNALSRFVCDDHAVDALFGTKSASFKQSAESFQNVTNRNTDGAWCGPSGPVNTRIGAVLFTKRLEPWRLGQCRARLFMNPWARKPLAEHPLAIDVCEVKDDQIHCTTGSSMAELLELPEAWPE